MHQISVNGKHQYVIESDTDEGVKINGKASDADVLTLTPLTFSVIKNLASYNVEVIAFDKALKTARIRVNSLIYSISAKDQFDLLLQKMGLNDQNSAAVSELKAPMPGMVLSVFAKEGDKVFKGDNLLTLEAMKMENIIKATTDAIVKYVKIKPGDKIVKGQILLQFA